MSIHPILLRAVLTAVVVEITGEQRLALCSMDDGVRIGAEDHLMDGIMLAMAAGDRGSDEVGASLDAQRPEQHS